MALSPLIDGLIEALRCLPGVGPKSAQRMAFHLLERNRDAALELARAIERAVAAVGRCESCRTLSEQALCRICASPRRDSRTLCVVETPADMAAIDASTGYQGMFFVLMGHLSPLDGIGPAELGLDQLERRLDAGEIAEVVLATSSTVEGEATAHYLAELVRDRGIRATRIAQGGTDGRGAGVRRRRHPRPGESWRGATRSDDGAELLEPGLDRSRNDRPRSRYGEDHRDRHGSDRCLARGGRGRTGDSRSIRPPGCWRRWTSGTPSSNGLLGAHRAGAREHLRGAGGGGAYPRIPGAVRAAANVADVREQRLSRSKVPPPPTCRGSRATSTIAIST